MPTKPKAKRGTGEAPKAAKRPTKAKPRAGKPRLLSGDNPQIPKGSGDAPVQAYIQAVPGWKQDVTRRIDAVVTRAVPGVRKAVKWNSPMYGAPDQEGWFLALHMYTKYVKVAFFRGRDLRPVPPGESKHPHVRYLDVREGDALDEAQMTQWVRQAAAIPGERM